MTIQEMIAELEGEAVDIIAYDTWGNEEDGYDVNDVRKIREGIEIEAYWAESYFGGDDFYEIDDRSSFDGIYEIVEKETGKPVGRIEVSQ